MIKIGIAGLGFMGMIHYLAYQKARGVKVAAICEQDPARLAGDWRSIKGNFGPPGQIMDLGDIARYSQLDALLADPNLDAIDICLPPSLHASTAIAALRAGKHVFCEKPIALWPEDAEAMVETARSAGRLLMIGHVLPFFPEYQFAYRAISDGRYGRLLGGYFKRIISDPLWLPDFYNPNTTGGPMVDLHIHDAHFVRLVCGMPKGVHTVGRMRGEVAELFHTQFVFGDSGPVVAASSGVIMQQGRPFTHGFEIYLEKATLIFDFATIGKDAHHLPLTVLLADGQVERPGLGSGDPVDAFAAEIAEVVEAIRVNRASPVLQGELARDALVLAHRQTRSLVEKRYVEV